MHLYQILQANINTIVSTANSLLQDPGGNGLRSYTNALDLGIDTFSYIAETCATILEGLTYHPTVIAWKTQVDIVIKSAPPEANLCSYPGIQLSSLNPASGQQVLYDESKINDVFKVNDTCAKFSVNRVLFNNLN